MRSAAKGGVVEANRGVEVIDVIRLSPHGGVNCQAVKAKGIRHATRVNVPNVALATGNEVHGGRSPFREYGHERKADAAPSSCAHVGGLLRDIARQRV